MLHSPALVLMSVLAALHSGPTAGAPTGPEPEPVRAFVGATLLPIAGPPIENGVLLVQGARIAAVGARADVAIPADAEVRDLEGRVLMPGLVCTHSHVGKPSGGDRSHPLQPEVRALDSIDVRHSSLMRARAGGLTTVNVMPGSGHLSSGQTVYLKLRRGDTVEELAIRTPAGDLTGGLKMANGTNSRREPPFPGTRGKSAALVRQRFVDAQSYRAKRARAAAEGEPPPGRDLALEALVAALEGESVVHHHTHRHDDVMTVLRLADEFGLRVVLHHVSDAAVVAEELAAAGVPCSLTLVDSPGGKLEARNVSFATGGVLERAGVPVAFNTDDYITDSRVFLRSPALAVRAGMSRAGALAAVTLRPAEMLDLDGRIGSLEAGKDADFVILDGDPLSVYTHVTETWVEGRRVFDHADPADRLYATGGWGAGDPEGRYHGCCWDDGGVSR